MANRTFGGFERDSQQYVRKKGPTDNRAYQTIMASPRPWRKWSKDSPFNETELVRKVGAIY